MFQKAEKKKVKLKIGISGCSGSGKTYSALRLATGIVKEIGGKIAVVDTENGSASLYADRFDFDEVSLHEPFTVEKYQAAVKAAVDGGFSVLILDSVSHQWQQLLEDKSKMDMRGGNSFTNWAKMTPKHNAFINTILQSDIHIIATTRSKQEYTLTANDKGKIAPKKMGLAPIAREGFEYELTCNFDVAINHTAEATKDRTSLFNDRIFQITEDTGKELIEHVSNGADVIPKFDPTNHISEITKYLKHLTKGFTAQEKMFFLKENTGCAFFGDLENLSESDLDEIIGILEAQVNQGE